MEIKIKLPKNTALRLTEPITAKDDEDVVLKFESDYNLSVAKIRLKNGEECDVYDFKESFTIPDKFMFAGRLFISVEMIHCDKIVKRWEIMPITLTETADGIKLVDYLTAIEERLSTLEKQHKIVL